MKRKLSCILLVVLIASMVTCAYAIETRASELISATGITTSRYTGGVMEFTARITATDVVDKLGFTSIKVQEYDGSSWNTVKTTTNKFAYDKVSHLYTVSYNGTVGKQYRAVVNYKVEDNGSSDTRTRTSSAYTAVS